MITLGVIGVVAALTMPTLIQKHQNQVYVNKLKKMISVLENGIRQAAVDEGVDVGKSEFFSIFNLYATDINSYDERYIAMQKYFKLVGKDTDNHLKTQLSGGTTTMRGAISLMDGSSINYISGMDSRSYYSMSIDVNGNNKPNVLGRDYFLIFLDENGLIKDFDNCDYNFIPSIKDSSEGVMTGRQCGLCEEKLKNNPNYEGCYLYRIRKDGWQMKY